MSQFNNSPFHSNQKQFKIQIPMARVPSQPKFKDQSKFYKTQNISDKKKLSTKNLNQVSDSTLQAMRSKFYNKTSLQSQDFSQKLQQSQSNFFLTQTQQQFQKSDPSKPNSTKFYETQRKMMKTQGSTQFSLEPLKNYYHNENHKKEQILNYFEKFDQIQKSHCLTNYQKKILQKNFKKGNLEYLKQLRKIGVKSQQGRRDERKYDDQLNLRQFLKQQTLSKAGSKQSLGQGKNNFPLKVNDLQYLSMHFFKSKSEQERFLRNSSTIHQLIEAYQLNNNHFNISQIFLQKVLPSSDFQKLNNTQIFQLRQLIESKKLDLKKELHVGIMECYYQMYEQFPIATKQDSLTETQMQSEIKEDGYGKHMIQKQIKLSPRLIKEIRLKNKPKKINKEFMKRNESIKYITNVYKEILKNKKQIKEVKKDIKPIQEIKQTDNEIKKQTQEDAQKTEKQSQIVKQDHQKEKQENYKRVEEIQDLESQNQKIKLETQEIKQEIQVAQNEQEQKVQQPEQEAAPKKAFGLDKLKRKRLLLEYIAKERKQNNLEDNTISKLE